MPNASRRDAETRPLPLLPDLLRTALGPVLALAPALLFAWGNPARNAWAAAALVLALILDHAARRVARAAHARTGVVADFRGVASPLLMLGDAVWLGGLLVAGVSWMRPDLFPLLASALAGLVAMGACARLALARTVVVLDEAEREAAREKADQTGRAR